jgi:twitching motility protein PilT
MENPPLDLLLRALIDHRGSDLHLSPGIEPRIRVDGEMIPLRTGALAPSHIQTLVEEGMDSGLRERWRGAADLDFAYQSRDLGRFRVNVYTGWRGVGAVLRVIPTVVPSAQELRLPAAITGLARVPSGMVLVTGPTGSGKSTTLAALVDLVNRERAGHIITIEDPVEFTHESRACIVTHREVGRDVASFPGALRAALREDPDVVVVGEIRDAETMQLALTAAETGHLVFGTLHTGSATRTANRVVDMVPPERQQQVRAQFAEVLRAIVTQRLVRKRGGGRLAAYEILLNTTPVQNNIRENKPALIEGAMNDRASGMQTLERALAVMVVQGWVEEDEASDAANSPESLRAEVGALRKAQR